MAWTLLDEAPAQRSGGWTLLDDAPPAPQPETYKPGDRVMTKRGEGTVTADGVEGADASGEWFDPNPVILSKIETKAQPIPKGTPELRKAGPASIAQTFSNNMEDVLNQSPVAAGMRAGNAAIYGKDPAAEFEGTGAYNPRANADAEAKRRFALDALRRESGATAPGGGDRRILMRDNPLTPNVDPVMVDGITGRVLTQGAAFAGGLVGGLRDPANIATLPAEAATIVGRIAQQAGINVAMDAPTQAFDIAAGVNDKVAALADPNGPQATPAAPMSLAKLASQYDPVQTAQQAAIGAMFQGAVDAPGAIRDVAGKKYSRTGEENLADIFTQDNAANRPVLSPKSPVELPVPAIAGPAPAPASRDVFNLGGTPVTVIGSDGANLRVVEVDPATMQPREGAPVTSVAPDALRDVPVPDKIDNKGRVKSELAPNIIQRGERGRSVETPQTFEERALSVPEEARLGGIMSRDKRVQITKRAGEQVTDIKAGQAAHAEMVRLIDIGVPRDQAQQRAIASVSRKNPKGKNSADPIATSGDSVPPSPLSGYRGVGSASEPAFDRAHYMGAAELDAAKARDARPESVGDPESRISVPETPDVPARADVPNADAPRVENVREEPALSAERAVEPERITQESKSAPDPEFESYKTRYLAYDADRNQFGPASGQKAARASAAAYVETPEFRAQFDEYKANKAAADARPDVAEDAPGIAKTAEQFAADQNALSATKATSEARSVFKQADEARAEGVPPGEVAARINAPDEPARDKPGFDIGPKPEKLTSADIPALDQRVKDLRKKVSQAQRAGNVAGETAWKAELKTAQADLKAAKAAARKNQTNAGGIDPADPKARAAEERRRQIDEELATLKAKREAADAERKAQEAKERAENAEAEKERLRQEYAAKYNVAPNAPAKAAPRPVKSEGPGILSRQTTGPEVVKARTAAKRADVAPDPEAIKAREDRQRLEAETTAKYNVPMSNKSPVDRARERVKKAELNVKLARGIPGAGRKAEAALAEARRALREAELKDAGFTGGGAKLYSNPLDPDLVKKAFKSRAFKKEVSEWTPENRNRAAVIKTLWELGKSTSLKDAGKALARTVQLLRGSDIGALRMYERWTKNITLDAGTAEALGIPKDYVGEPIVRWIADQLGSDPGSGRKIGQAYQYAADQRAKIKVNQLGDILRGYSAKEREAAAALLANTKFGREVSTPRVEALRTKLRAWLDDQYEYLVDAGVKINNHADYYTRIPDRMVIEKDPAGFIEAAAEVYKARGMDEAEAGSRAVAYFNSIMYPPSSRTRGMADMLMGSPDHSAKRVFGKEADELLAPYYVRDPLEALAQYAQRTSMLAEQTRRFGYNGERLATALDILRREMPNNVEDFDKIVAHIGSARGMLASSVRFPGMATMRGIGSWVQVWGSLRFLARTSIYQVTEPINVGMRSHNLLNAPRAFFTQFDQYLGVSAGAREAKQFAHVIGVAGDAAKQLIMDAYSQGIASELPRRITTAFFDRVLTAPITEAQRIVALRVWRPAFEGMLDDVIDGKGALASAKVVLGEYGITEKNAPSVRAWLDELEDMQPEARYEKLALDMSEPAKLYRAAMHDFALKSILEPTLAETPHYAKHPLGQMAYAITSFMYAATREIRNRAFKSVGLAFGKDVDLASRLALLTPLMGYAFYGGVMTYVNYLRQNVFAPSASKDMAPQDWIRAGLSASGLYGTLDPLQQILFPKGRYEKDISTLFGLDFPLAFAKDLGDMWAARPWSEANSPDTNNAEYKAARAAYSAIIAPVATAALAITPLGPVSGVAAGGAAMYASSRRAADDFATATVGPRGQPTTGNREDVREWRTKQRYKESPRGKREAAREARYEEREKRRRRND